MKLAPFVTGPMEHVPPLQLADGAGQDLRQWNATTAPRPIVRLELPSPG